MRLMMVCLLWLGTALAQAESVTFSDGSTNTSNTADNAASNSYTVHYIAVNSTFLTPEIAAQYNITRSSRRAFLNIAVLRNHADGSTTPVTAVLKGGKRNLLQQEAAIPFTEIREGESIYYIGQFDFSNAETLRFSVDVLPTGSRSDHSLEWTTQLYAD
jgi:Domain of unknown function (DUF4426)